MPSWVVPICGLQCIDLFISLDALERIAMLDFSSGLRQKRTGCGFQICLLKILP